jgi:hypothetical protein
MKAGAYDIWKMHSNPNLNFDYYYNFLVDKIKNHNNISLIRICDGEYGILFDKRSFANQLNNEEIDVFHKKLTDIIEYKLNNRIPESKKGNLFFATEHGTRYSKKYENNFALIKKIDNASGNIPATLFSYMTVSGKMEEFFDLLNTTNRPVIVVGPPHTAQLQDLNVSNHIVTDLIKSWKKQDEVENELNQIILNYVNDNKSPIILYGCAVTGKMAISKNYLLYGDKITQLDVGANLDPYCGVSSRPWHSEIYLEYKRRIRASQIEKLKQHKIPDILLSEYLYPTTKPDIEYLYSDLGELDKTGFNSYLDPNTDRILKEFLNDKTHNIIEIGNWAGISTKKLREHANYSNVFILNAWDTNIDAYPATYYARHTQEKRAVIKKLSLLWQNFLLNCWDIRENIHILRGNPIDKIDELAIHEIYIDVIYINNLFEEDTHYNIIQKCLSNWPEAIIIGDGYESTFNNFQTKRVLDKCKTKFNIKIKNKGSVWFYEPVTPKIQ